MYNIIKKYVEKAKQVKFCVNRLNFRTDNFDYSRKVK